MSSTKKRDQGVFGRLFGRKPAIPTVPPTEDAIRVWLVERLATQFAVAPEEIDVRETFSNYGLDSRTAVSLSGELERWLGRTLSPTLVWDYPTIELVARHLASGDDPQFPGSALIDGQEQ
jgi:acyl carrier protein